MRIRKIKSISRKKFLEAKESEVNDFIKKFKEAKKFSSETANESPITSNEIKKYIALKKSVPQVNKLLIQLFIFLYHFTQKEYINKIIEKLDLTNIEYLPTIDYDQDKKI